MGKKHKHSKCDVDKARESGTFRLKPSTAERSLKSDQWPLLLKAVLQLQKPSYVLEPPHGHAHLVQKGERKYKMSRRFKQRSTKKLKSGSKTRNAKTAIRSLSWPRVKIIVLLWIFMMNGTAAQYLSDTKQTQYQPVIIPRYRPCDCPTFGIVDGMAHLMNFTILLISLFFQYRNAASRNGNRANDTAAGNSSAPAPPIAVIAALVNNERQNNRMPLLPTSTDPFMG